MDTFVLILAIGMIVLLALILIIYRFTRKEIQEIEHRQEDTITVNRFETGRHPVRRNLTVDAKAQRHQGASRKITVEAGALPDLTNVTPGKDKGIDAIVQVVMNPIVRYADSREEVIEFEPPLEIVIDYTAEDAKATTLNAEGIPQLSITQAYQTPEGWKWERLKTRVSPTSPGGPGTLHTQLHTLRPKDPLMITRP